MPQSQDLFRVVATASGETTFLDLSGDLDIISMPEFELALALVISKKPKNILFDLLNAGFVCGAGYAAIGQCSDAIEHLIVCSKNNYAQKILRILGYHRVVFVTMEHPLQHSKVPQTVAPRHLVEREAC